MKTSFNFIRSFLFQKNELLILGLVVIIVTNAHADDSGSYSSFDSIVKELSSSRINSSVETTPPPIESIKFHASLGFTTSLVQLDLPNDLPDSKSMRGIELRLGIDLFSPHWVAEGAVRTFTPEPFLNGEITLKEFDLLFVYKNSVNKPLNFSFGGGMTSRYMDLRGINISGVDTSSATPASVILAGASTAFSESFSLGAAISYRDALVSKTADEGSIDGTLQFNGRF